MECQGVCPCSDNIVPTTILTATTTRITEMTSSTSAVSITSVTSITSALEVTSSIGITNTTSVTTDDWIAYQYCDYDDYYDWLMRSKTRTPEGQKTNEPSSVSSKASKLQLWAFF